METLVAGALSKKLCKIGRGYTYFTIIEKLEVARKQTIRGHRCLGIHLEQRLLFHESHKAMLFLPESNQESIAL